MATTINGTTGNDSLTGTSGDDSLKGGLGNDTLSGGAGTNTAVYVGKMANFRVKAKADGSYTVTDADTVDGGDEGTDTLTNVQKLEFADGTLTVEMVRNEEQVSSITSGDQRFQSVALLEDGSSVVVWQDSSSGDWKLYGKRFAADGSEIGSQFQVPNSQAGGRQALLENDYDGNRQSVASLKGGGFVVAWTGQGINDGYADVWARIYNSDGSPSGTAIHLNSSTLYSQFNVAVAGLSNGGFVATWISNQEDNYARYVYTRQFDASGNPIGNDTKVDVATRTNNLWSSSPAVAALTAGGYVIAWSQDSGDGNGSGIRAQRFDESGSKVGNEFTINTYTESDQRDICIASLPSGGFVAAWTSWWQDGSFKGVYLQRFDALGAKVGTETKVNSTSAGYQAYPQIAVQADGSFLVSWSDDGADGSGWGVYAQRFDDKGAALGAETLINNFSAGDQNRSSAVALKNGAYALFWNSYNQDGSGWGLERSVLDSDGGLYILKVTGDAQANKITQPYASTIDGGAGADTMEGGSGPTTYVVDNVGDLVVDTGSGGGDEVRSSVTFTLPSAIENLTLTGSEKINGTGNSLANRIVGNDAANSIAGMAGDDSIQGGGGDDTIEGGEGNDTIDGGSGINTLVLSGSRTDYYIPSPGKRDANGFVIKTTDDAILAGIKDGNDTISNIQKIIFLGETEPTFKTMVLDDYSNASDAGNTVIEYGKLYSGILNFKNDVDFFKLSTINGQSVNVQFTESFYRQGFRFSKDGFVDSSSDLKYGFTGQQDFSIENQNWDWSGTNALPYSFIIRRNWTGTDGADSMDGSGSYERLLGGAGNDTLKGGATSDSLDGGSGNDILTGGKGDDTIEGGSGLNTAVFAGKRADYLIEFIGDSAWRVTDKSGGGEGVDYVRNIQTLQFDDGTYTLDDYSNLLDTGFSATTYGRFITGTANFNGDYDWFYFDFKTLPQGSALKITLEGGGGGQRVRFTDADGNSLLFRTSADGGTNVEWVNVGSQVLYPYQWANGDDFIGGRVYVMVYADSGWTTANYRLSIARLLQGTQAADTLSTEVNNVHKYDELSGLAGNDTLTGGDLSDRLSGGDGNDSLTGNAGDDYLAPGAGQDTVFAGDGDDIISVADKTTVTDRLDGEGGTDTLEISATTDLSSAKNITNIEVIKSTNGGTFNFTAAQLTSWGVTRLDNLGVSLTAAGTFDASGISGDYSLVGSTGDDVLKAGSGNNVILARGGSATVEAGAGDDVIRFQPADGYWNVSGTQSEFLQGDLTSRKYTLVGSFDGGAGSDALEFSFPFYWWAHSWNEGGVRDRAPYSVDLSKATLNGIEILRVVGDTGANNAPAYFTMSTSQLAGFSQLVNVKGVNLVGGGSVDLAAFAAKGGVNLTFGDALGYTLQGSAQADQIVDSQGNDSVVAGAGDDVINATGGVDTLLAGDGDDVIAISGKTAITDSIDGGAGNDTLRITGGDVDLTGAKIANVERIEVNATSLAMTADQWTQLGSLIVETGSTKLARVLPVDKAGTYTVPTDAAYTGLKGSSGDDILIGNAADNQLLGSAGNDDLQGGDGNDLLQGGDGNDSLMGGKGNDTLEGGSGTNVAVFAGKMGDFRIDAVGDGSFKVTDTNATDAGDEGTDTLIGVKKLQFTDGTLTVNATAVTESQINVYTSNEQTRASMAKLVDGSLMLVWQSAGQDGSDWGIYGRKLDALGRPVGTEFKINTRTDSNQSLVDEGPCQTVAALSDGGFVVVWRSWDENSWGVFAQRFDASGQAVGPELAVNTYTTDQQRDPSVTGLAGGGFVVAWMSNGQDGSEWGVYGQVYDAKGAKSGNEFKLNTATAASQYSVIVNALSGGGFVATWRDDSTQDAKAQIFGSDGTKVGSEITLNTYTNDWQTWSSTASLPDGGFWAVWQSSRQDDGGSWGIYAQRFSATGSKVGGEIRINETTGGNQDSPQITTRSDGSFIITWSSYGQDGSGYGVYARAYNADGTPASSEMRVNSVTDGDQRLSDVVALDNGGFMVTWQSSDGSGNGIFSRVWDPATGFNQLQVTGDANATRIAQPYASLIDGGAGADTMEGGSGNTVYMVDNTGDVVVEKANGGVDEVRSSVSYTLSDNVENLTLTGSGNLSGAGNALANTLLGNDGANSLSGLAGDDLIQGGAGADTLVGGLGNDTLDGGTGDNVAVYAGKMADFTIKSGANGAIIVTDTNATDAGDEGTDTLIGVKKLQFVDGTLTYRTISGSELRVNEYTNSEQTQASIAKLADGSLMLVWQSAGQDGSDWGLYGRKLDDSGSPVGSEFKINTQTGSNQSTADESALQSVAALSDGGFVVVWRSWWGDQDNWGVIAQRFDASGVPVGSEFVVNTYTSGEQRDPSVTGLAGGGFVVTWMSNGQDGSGWGVYGQIYDAKGAKSSSEFRLNTATSSDQYAVHVNALSAGGFVATWRDNSSGDAKAQIFGSDGTKVGSEFTLNTYTNDSQVWSSAASLPDGGFWAVWMSHGQDDGHSWGIYAQRFSSTGSKVGGEIRINETTAVNQDSPQITTRSDGSFIITWSSYGQDGSGYGVYARAYNADGTPASAEMRANTVTDGDQRLSDVVALDNGGFLVTWQSNDGSANGIFSRVWDPVYGFSQFSGLQVSGDAGVNKIVQPFATIIDGGAGADTMEGGSGNTVYVVDNTGDVVVEKANGGVDEVRSSVSYTLSDNLEMLTLTGSSNLSGTGSSQGDTLVGNDGANSLSGMAGDDLVQGGAGADTLVGGLGDDTLDGGTGDNVAVYAGKMADYTIKPSGDGSFTVTDNDSVDGGNEGTDTLTKVQNLQFADQTISVAAGAAADTQVNIFTNAEQSGVSLAKLVDGSLIAVWQSNGQDGSDWGLYGRKVDASGRPVGAEFKLNTTSNGNQSFVDYWGESPLQSVAALSDGGFVVAWRWMGSDQDNWGVVAQRFDAAGRAVGMELLVNTFTSGEQRDPSVTGLSGGGFVVAWMSNNQDGSEWGVFAQIYESNGAKKGQEFKLHTVTSSSQYAVHISALKEGGFVATWRDQSTNDAKAQVYDATGAKVGSEFTLNTSTNDTQYFSSTAPAADGGFWAVWSSANQNGDPSWGIYAQRFNAKGEKVGSEFRINETTADQQHYAQISTRADGSFVVTWSSQSQDGSGWGVYARAYDADGKASTSEMRINKTTDGDQVRSDVMALDSGGFLVTWQSDDGSGTGIFSQVWDPITGLNRLEIKGDDKANKLSQPYAALIDGGAGADTMEGGSGSTTYVVDNVGDVVIEKANGGSDEIRSSITYTLLDNIESLTLTGNEAISGAGNALANTLVGNEAANSLTGFAGDDVIQSGGGDDTIDAGEGNDIIDGGSGTNTLVLSGTRADYNIPSAINSSATGIVIRTVGEGVKDGNDTISNIQKIVFLGETDPAFKTLVLDDYSNASDASNTMLEYGKVYAGVLNFKNDIDYFKLLTVSGQSLNVEITKSHYTIAGWLSQGTTTQQSWNNVQRSDVTANVSAVQDFRIFNTDWNWSGAQPFSYAFVIRRNWTGTDGADSIDGSGSYERLLGGLGDDTLKGGATSDILDGGAGNDVLTGGRGNDTVEGGSGLNVATYAGNKADYVLEFLGDSAWRLTHKNGGADGVDYLRNVQTLQFADGLLILDDYSNSQDSAIAAVSFGQSLNGVSNFQGDSDWFNFDFKTLGSGTSLKLTLEGTNGASQRFQVVDASGNLLYFKDSQGKEVTQIYMGSQVLTPDRWGPNGEGGSFIGGKGWIQLYADGWNMSSAGYRLTIARYLEGTSNSDTLSTEVGGVRKYDELNGMGGNDTLTGGDLADRLLAGEGSDSLVGNGGDDYLAPGPGKDTVFAGTGDDVISVADKTAVTDRLDGGEGDDTLEIGATTDLSGATISSIETIKSTSGGNFAFTLDQLKSWGVSRLDNLGLTLSLAGTLDASAISGNYSLVGSTGDDVLKAGDGNNTILARGGSATVEAGAGDDTIQFRANGVANFWDWSTDPNLTKENFLKGDQATRTYSLQGSYGGGTGLDTLEFWFPNGWGHAWDGWSARDAWPYSIDLSKATLSGIEVLKVTDPNSGNNSNNNLGNLLPTHFTMTADQLAGFSQLVNVKGVKLVGGGTVDLAAFAAKGGVNLSFGDAAGYTLQGSALGDEITDTRGNDSVVAGGGDDVINSTGGVDTLLGGDGNDVIAISGKVTVVDSMDGGAGTDTLRIVGDDVDLSGTQISNIERIEVSSRSLSMTADQWANLGPKIVEVGSAKLIRILTVQNSGTTTLTADAAYSGLTGTAGDDRLVGNAADNLLVGGAGNDELLGNDGNDRLVTGAGLDVLSGGAGDDTLLVTDKEVSRDTLDGGAGKDTLLVTTNVDLSGAVLTGLETLAGSATVSNTGPQSAGVAVTLTAAQLAQFTDVSNVTVQIAGQAGNFSLGSVKLGPQVLIRLADYDTTVLATTGVVGSKGEDTIIGSASDDLIYGGRGADRLDGGQGADTLVGGGGTDILIGGAGDDTFRVEASEFEASSSSRLVSDSLSGGDGIDTLEVNFTEWGSSHQYYISKSSLDSVERLVLNSVNNDSVSFDASAFRGLTTLVVNNQQAYVYSWLKMEIAGDGKDLDLSAISSQTRLEHLSLTGTFGNIDARTVNITTWPGFTDRWANWIDVQSMDSIVLGDANNRLAVYGDSTFKAELGQGDDVIRILSVNALKATIDGGAGQDTLDLSDIGGLIDLSKASLTGIEYVVYASNARLIVTQAQLDAMSFEGSGAKYIRVGDLVTGTADNDDFAGNGTGSFQGGKGDDTIRDVQTAVFTGNYADYSFTRNDNGSLTVKQERGSLADGTDTLWGVQKLQFADATQTVDDRPNEVWNYLGTSPLFDRSALDLVSYGKKVSGKKDYGNDTDVFRAELVPNSPLVIDGSGLNGSSWSITMWDAVTGQQLRFKSLTNGWESNEFNNGMQAAQKWLPGYYSNSGQFQFIGYQGGEVIIRVSVNGTSITSGVQDYSFTLNYQDDYASDTGTLGQMDAQTGTVRGYIGDKEDSDWIRTELVAGTTYVFNLKGASSSGGTLVDPKLQLLDSQGRVVDSGISVGTDAAGLDDKITFKATTAGTYYLAVTDVAKTSLGSWTLTQQSLDLIAGNTSSNERVTWEGNATFTVSSEINVLSDHDWFKVWLDKGVTYKFRNLGASSGATLNDPQLSLRSITGILLSQNDNDGQGTDAQLVFSAPDSGWYWLDAGASGNMGKGTYVLQGSTLADDYSNDLQTTGVVTIDQAFHGLLSYVGDSDWLKVGLSKGKTYIIDLTGDDSAGVDLDPLIDPILIIRDSTGKEVFRSDDFDSSLNARAYFTPTTDGLYYLEARSAYKYDVGAYQVKVSMAPPDDHGNTTSAATALTLGQATAGVIGQPGDRDFFKIVLEAGKVYQFKVDGQGSRAGSLLDPFLRVFDSNGHLVDFDNNSGSGNDSTLYLSPTESGTYYLEASANQDRGMGTYQVSVTQRDLPVDDVPNDIRTKVILTPGDTFAGTLLTHNDQDWFGIKLEAGQDYVFRVLASTSGSGSLADPVLEIRNAAGELIKSIDNMLTTNEPAVSFSPSASGTYFLVVKAADGQTQTGTYTVVTRAPDDFSNTKLGAAAIALNETLNGAIQWNDGAFGVRAYDSVGLATDSDEDWFKFVATKDQVLSVTVKLPSGSTLSRPLIEIVDNSGKTLAVGDGLETKDGQAVATFKVPEGGTYFARVIDGAGAVGAYQISLTLGDASDEDSSAPAKLDFVTTGAVTVAAVQARIGLAGDTDKFTVDLQEGHSYRIETVAVRDGARAPLPSAGMTLAWRGQGASSDVSVDVNTQVGDPSSFNSTVYEASKSGTMTITVAAGQALETGQYKVRVIDLGLKVVDDRPDSVRDYTDSNGVVTINDSASGQIGSVDDVDLFAVSLTKGNIYDFSIKSFVDGLGTLSQGQLRLLDAKGNLVSAGTFDAVSGRTDLAVSVFEDGRYYLAVSAAPITGNTGTYVLDTRLRGADTNKDDLSADTRSGAFVTPGKPVTGTVDYAGDEDWIKVTLVGGKVYVLDVLGDGAKGGTLKDATLRLLDANGNELAFDDNSGAAGDAHLQFTPGADGDYYLDVGGTAAATGTYTVRVRELYSGVADPLKSAQWYLTAMGVDALKGQVSGARITIGVVDEGIDTSHPDLQNQLNASLAYDTQFNTRDGSPKYPVLMGPPDNHGTAVAGIIAAQANNETGIVGIAPDATLVSTRVKWTWEQITQALSLQWKFDISNNSWGASNPFSDNFNSTSLTYAYEALRTGVEDGRQGKGTVFVFSAGNSAAQGDNSNYHNFQNAREVITVGAANPDGSAASFSTPGASVLVSAYGVGLLTTDRHQAGWGYDGSSGYTSFSGTSAAAPVVSGVVALMLEANPNLGYRDVQEILAYSALHPNNQDWKTNGAGTWNLGGLKFNDAMGFGLVDAYAAVQLASTWNTTHTAFNEALASARSFGMAAAIPDGDGKVLTKTFHIDTSIKIEHVELAIDLRHTRLGDLIIELVSPNGTVTTLVNRPTVNSEQPFGLTGTDAGLPTHLVWDFSSVQFWGEDSAGDWTINIKDVRAEETGTLNSLSLRVYGQLPDGSDTYVFTEEGFDQAPSRVLSDESGTDTINASPLLHDMVIDLAAGEITSRGVTYKIDQWTVIENAISGAGDDRLVGNDATNQLVGGDGSDTLVGGLGNDTITGGYGADTAVYSGSINEYTVSWNPNTKTITVVDVKSSNGDEGTDVLTGIERLRFSDGDINLSKLTGNSAPVALKSFFDAPVKVSKGLGVDFGIPSNAFSDPDANDSKGLTITISNSTGGELPPWLTYDPKTGKFGGVPPADFQGQLKILVKAVDSYGETTSGILTLQFGDNQAPVVENPKEMVIKEDAVLVALGITAPTDPEGKAVTVKITDIFTNGVVLDKMGNVVAVGTVLTADALTELHYQTAADANGNMGYLRYQATDADGVVSESSVHLFVDAVNDAPRFATAGSKLMLTYPLPSQAMPLDVSLPTDPESTIDSVKVVGLPELGSVLLDGKALKLNQVLTIDQLQRLKFTLTENVNGPIGSLTIQAVDPQGLATNWSLALEVQGQAGSNQGTSGADALYGSIGEDTLYGLGGDDTLAGNAGNDKLLGGLGDDQLFGGSGNDTLDGSSGNDTLDGGAGADVLIGGPGNDTYFVDATQDQVLEVISGGAGGKDLIVTSVSLTAPTNVENLQAVAGLAIDLTGNELDNVLIGNELANRLVGGLGRDSLFGGAGDDTLDGGSGVDRLAGGAGDDTYFVDSRSDVVVELIGEGTDTVRATTSYTLSSNIESLILEEGGDYTGGGNSLDNYIRGNSGNNVLAGGLGKDTLEGGVGDDVYVLSDSLDIIIDTGGTDTIRSSVDVVLPGFIENAELVGIADINATGSANNNLLIGNVGNNILDGRGGVDTLTGGDGSDQFIISYNGDGIACDEITDFEVGKDLLVIDLLSFGISPSAAGLQGSGTVSTSAFVVGKGAQALDADDHFIFDTATGVLMFDPDGSGSLKPIVLVKFTGGKMPDLHPTDIFVAV